MKFADWRRYDGKNAKGVDVGTLCRDDDGMLRENFLFKGDNLQALQSIKSQFNGKVKLVYADPPYNTGGGAEHFTYHNKFNQSAWLSFMRERLQLARQLLRNDGFIAIAIDHHELFYIGALADEIFGRKNRVGVVTVKHHPHGRCQSKFFSATNEFMLVYAKSTADAVLGYFDVSDEEIKKIYSKADDVSAYRLCRLIRAGESPNSYKDESPNQHFPIYISDDLATIQLQEREGFMRILPVENGIARVWRYAPKTMQQKIDTYDIVAKRTDKACVDSGVDLYYKRRSNVYKGRKPTTTWIDKSYDASVNGTRLLQKLLGRKGVSYPKSLYTVLDTVKITTTQDDIVLDLFGGSGTTGHAVLALNAKDGGRRQFILCEKLDAHVDVCVARMQKVMQQNNSGSFVYCKLASHNGITRADQKINDQFFGIQRLL